ncbi:hypothetical protein L9F63_006468, partial [Diploptera punctata]
VPVNSCLHGAELPDKMSDLEDFDHVFDVFVYADENNGSGFIAENSGSPVIGTSSSTAKLHRILLQNFMNSDGKDVFFRYCVKKSRYM